MAKGPKTNKATAKRFRVTAKGKLKHNRPGAGHLMSCKSASRRRKLRKAVVTTSSHHQLVMRALGLR